MRLRRAGVGILCLSLLGSCRLFGGASAEPDEPAETAAAPEAKDDGANQLSELDRLRTRLEIPGMSAALVQSGRIVWKQGFGDADASEVFPIASITKTMTAVVAILMVGDGKLDVDRPAVSYVRGLDVPAHVTVRQLLSHTSVGTAGQTFSYNGSRYARLAAVLEAAGGAPLAEQLQTRLFGPAAMAETRVTEDFNGSSGVLAPVDDLARYAARLLDGSLVARPLRDQLFTAAQGPDGTALPYGLGWFVHDLGGETIVWHYGQLPDHSSLLVLAPERRSAFVLLARSDRASAPFALVLGRPLWSPFVELVLPWLGVGANIHQADAVVGKALLAGIRDRAGMERQLRALIQSHPRIAETPDAGMLHVLARTEDPELRAAAESIGKALMRTRGSDPRTKFDLAVLRLSTGRAKRAVALLEEVIALEGHPVLVAEASFVLGEYLHAKDPAKARAHLERVVDLGVDPGLVRDAQALLGAAPDQGKGADKAKTNRKGKKGADDK